MLRTCREHGLEIADAGRVVNDPFGNRLELMEPDA
jgi:hypothetical protein